MCIPPGVRKYCSTEVVRYRQAKTHTKVSHAFPFPVQGDIVVRNARRQHEPEIIAGDGASRRARRRRRRCLRPTTCQPASTALHIASCARIKLGGAALICLTHSRSLQTVNPGQNFALLNCVAVFGCSEFGTIVVLCAVLGRGSAENCMEQSRTKEG